MSEPTLTPAQHHDRLMAEIDHEVTTYGVASLAGLIASTLDGRCCGTADTDDTSPRAEYYREAIKLFATLSNQLSRLSRPFDLPDTKE